MEEFDIALNTGMRKSEQYTTEWPQISFTRRLNAERQLLTYVGQQLKGRGFNPKPVGQDFWQKKPVGKWAFHISFIPHEKDFDLTAHVAIRIDEIEDLVNKYDPKRTPAEKRKSMTFGGELGNLSQGRPLRWTVETMENIAVVGDAVINAFDSIGWPFLDGHSDLAAAHKVFTSEKPTDVLLAPIIGPRYMRAVASAYLLRETQELLTLVPRYETKLRQEDDLCRGIGSVPS